jgi:hypothetical protein
MGELLEKLCGSSNLLPFILRKSDERSVDFDHVCGSAKTLQATSSK